MEKADQKAPSGCAEYICGEEPLPAGSNLIIKRGHVSSQHEECYNRIQAGAGSVYGGKWKPAKSGKKAGSTISGTENWTYGSNARSFHPDSAERRCPFLI